MNVEFKDRIKQIEELRQALAMVEIFMPYETADLLFRTYKTAEKRGEHFSIDDATFLRQDWQRDWDDYELNHKDSVK